jgi:hypothetical protein
MEQSSVDMLLFCTDFIEKNFKEYSQNSNCRMWIRTAVDILKKTEDDSSNFIISEFEHIDEYLSGKDEHSNISDILTKISTIKILLNDIK